MKNKNKLSAMLFFLAGILFLLSAIIGKNIVFVPIGCCFIVLSIVFSNKKSDDDKNSDQ